MDGKGTRRAVLGGIGAGLVAGALGLPAWAQGSRKLGYAIVGLGNYATNQIMPRLGQCEFAELRALVSVAIGAGATVASHVNDTGFWLVKQYLGLTEAQTFKSWTLCATLAGATIFAMALLLWPFA